MPEPNGTADSEADDVLDDDEAATAVAEDEGADDAEAPRRRLVSELLEGQEELDEAAPDLQLVATPIHVEPVESGQAVYQLDLSGGEPEGTLIAPEVGDVAAVTAPGGAATPEPITTAADAHSAVRELIAQRDLLVMAAERDGVSAYELAAEIDQFVDVVITSVRHYEQAD